MTWTAFSKSHHGLLHSVFPVDRPVSLVSDRRRITHWKVARRLRKTITLTIKCQSHLSFLAVPDFGVNDDGPDSDKMVMGGGGGGSGKTMMNRLIQVENTDHEEAVGGRNHHNQSPSGEETG